MILKDSALGKLLNGDWEDTACMGVHSNLVFYIIENDMGPLIVSSSCTWRNTVPRCVYGSRIPMVIEIIAASNNIGRLIT